MRLAVRSCLVVIGLAALGGCWDWSRPRSLLEEADAGWPDAQAAEAGTLDVSADGPRLEGSVADLPVDAVADVPTVDALPPPDLPAMDTTVGPDLPKPDTTVDLLPIDVGPPVYLDEPFTTSKGSSTAETGNWVLSGGGLTQTDTSYNGRYIVYGAPVSDYVAESELTINNLPPDPWLQGAGIGVRVQGGAVASYPPAMYVCVISPDGNWLGIIKCPGGTTYDCNLPIKQISNPFSVGVAYRMTMRAQGSTLTCALPDLGLSVVATDSSYTTGGVTLATFQTSTTFAYLKVYAP